MCSHAACYKGKGPVLCGPARGQRRLPGGDSVTTETLRMSRSYQVRGLEEGERMEKPMDRGPAWARQDRAPAPRGGGGPGRGQEGRASGAGSLCRSSPTMTGLLRAGTAFLLCPAEASLLPVQSSASIQICRPVLLKWRPLLRQPLASCGEASLI